MAQKTQINPEALNVASQMILKEIDLTGTDAERKAKLAKFETNWKALTGASDTRGARFVGLIDAGDYGFVTALLIYDYNMGVWEGIGNRDDSKQCRVQVAPTGTLHITPLFSHLEAITIYTDNTPEHKQANLANIAAYEANLEALGVDTSKSHIIPFGQDDFERDGYGRGYLVADDNAGDVYLGQFQITDGTIHSITINGQGEVNNVRSILDDFYKSLNAKSLEAVVIKKDNTPESKAANVAAIKAYVDNLKALGVDITKGYMIPFVTTENIYGELFNSPFQPTYLRGIARYSSYSYWVEVNITEGGVNLGFILDALNTYGNLETTFRQIIPAINEVNALAKGYSTIFTPIELTTETAQNKTAIDARVAAFTAQGISLTNGCCIPVTYTGVYAGNISLINGDWYGLLVKNTNNPADNINIKLAADGTIVTSNSAQ